MPFLYATNSRPSLRQLETESGIWFLDARQPTNHARPLTGWHTADVLTAMLVHDAAAAQAVTSVQDALGCSLKAMEGLEQTFQHNSRRGGNRRSPIFTSAC